MIRSNYKVHPSLKCTHCSTFFFIFRNSVLKEFLKNGLFWKTILIWVDLCSRAMRLSNKREKNQAKKRMKMCAFALSYAVILCVSVWTEVSDFKTQKTRRARDSVSSIYFDFVCAFFSAPFPILRWICVFATLFSCVLKMRADRAREREDEY